MPSDMHNNGASRDLTFASGNHGTRSTEERMKRNSPTHTLLWGGRGGGGVIRGAVVNTLLFMEAKRFKVDQCSI